MKEWIISAKAKIYDHSSSFEDYGFIDWRQGQIKYEVNDIVFIYCTRPISSIRYKCIVESIDLQHDDIRDDREYWSDIEEYEKSLDGKFMRLRLIDQISDHNMDFKSLKKNGLTSSLQSPTKVVPVLSEYINKYFAVDSQEVFFPDTLDRYIYEGMKKQIIVNKYERSPIARNECIKYYGLNCVVCEMNFYDTYGDIGIGFIHVHHKYPMHQIGKEYKINYKEDLVPVCPNCHSMLHRKINGAYPSIDDLKLILENIKNKSQ